MPASSETSPTPTSRPRRRRGPLRLILMTLAALWLALGLALALIVTLDLALTTLFALKDRIRPLPNPDPRVVQQGYDSAPWVEALYRDQARLEAEWAPYSGFRLKPFQSKFTNINAASERVTWQAPATSPDVPEVLVLGGSSAWGLGARDDHTIPSELARALHDLGIPARVTNAAQIGHVQTQELVTLIQRLKAGDRPRVVIFYDGVNDILAPLQSGHPGWPQNAQNRQAEFNLFYDRDRLLERLLFTTAHKSAFARLADSAARRLGLRSPSTPSAMANFDQTLACKVVANIEANVAILDGLCTVYDMTALIYWQPTLFNKQTLTAFEQEKATQYAWLRDPITLVQARLSPLKALETHRVRFHDLSDFFLTNTGQIMVDFCHTTEAANAPLARRMARDVALILSPDPAPDGDPRP